MIVWCMSFSASSLFLIETSSQAFSVSDCCSSHAFSLIINGKKMMTPVPATAGSNCARQQKQTVPCMHAKSGQKKACVHTRTYDAHRQWSQVWIYPSYRAWMCKLNAINLARLMALDPAVAVDDDAAGPGRRPDAVVQNKVVPLRPARRRHTPDRCRAMWKVKGGSWRSPMRSRDSRHIESGTIK